MSSAVSDRSEYKNDPIRGYVSGFDTNVPAWGETAEIAWQAIMKRPFIAGGFTWTGWDYRGEPTPDGWPDVSSHFGIIDAAGFWKDLAYWYYAWWARPFPPVLHVFPHWNWSPQTCEGACHIHANTMCIDVWAYSNAEEVELFLPNGTSMGRQRMELLSHVEWRCVPYIPGQLLARAFVNGIMSGSISLQTTGSPAAVRLRFQDGYGVQGLTRDSDDVALIVAEVVDLHGQIVPTASSQIAFSATGLTVVGTANGDPACLTPSNSSVRAAFHGLLLVIVRASAHEYAETGFVQASSQGLIAASLQVHINKQSASLPASLPHTYFV